MQHLGDEGQPPAAVLAGLDELIYLTTELRGWVVANQASIRTQDLPVAQVIDFRLNFFDASAQTRSQSGSVHYHGGVAIKEHQDVPSQKGPDVGIDELRDCGPQDAFEIVQACDRPSRSHDRTHDNP